MGSGQEFEARPVQIFALEAAKTLTKTPTPYGALLGKKSFSSFISHEKTE